MYIGTAGLPMELNRRRYVKIAGAGVVGLSGCMGGNQDGDEQNGGDQNGGTATPTSKTPGSGDLSGTEIHMISAESSEKGQEVISRLTSDFEEETNAKVTVEYQGFDTLFQRLTQLIQAGNPPEISFLGIPDTGVLGHEPLAQVDSVLDTFNDLYGDVPSIQRYQVDGHDYYLPFFGGANMNWYREDIVSSPVPNTWENNLEMVKEADQTEGIHGAFIAAGQTICPEILSIGWGYTNEARTVQRENGRIVSAIGRGDNKQKWIETLEYMNELHEYSPQAADAGCSEMINAMATGSYAVTPYYGARPKVQTISQERDFAKDTRASLFPKKETQVTYGSVNGHVIFKNSNVDAARELMKFAYQPDYFMDMLTIAPLHNVPPGEAGKHPKYKEVVIDELPDAWSQNDIDVCLDRMNYIQLPGTETDPPNGEARALMRQNVFSRMRFNVMIEGQDPAQAVDEAHQKAEQILESQQE